MTNLLPIADNNHNFLLVKQNDYIIRILALIVHTQAQDIIIFSIKAKEAIKYSSIHCNIYNNSY